MAHRILVGALSGCFLLFAGTSSAQEVASSSAREVATPFLFQIEGKGTSGFLYGTVHLADKRVVTLPGSVTAALDLSDSFFAEIEATAASEAKVQKMAMMPAGESLDVLVGSETWKRVEAQFIKAGHPAMMAKGMARLEPWAFSSLLPMLGSLEEMAARPALDKMLYQRAEKAGKSVAGLETVEEQVELFRSFTRDEQVQMLRDSLTLLEEYQAAGRDVMEEMIAAWMSGDSAALVALLDDGFGTDPAIRERAEQALLWKRNVRFAERMEAAMAAAPAKTAFFAVGALHIPNAPKAPKAAGAAATDGSEASGAPKLGVVELLRRRGYTVTRVGSGVAVPAKAGK
jgi:uncharacterized protein YbaP (TraB family)